LRLIVSCPEPGQFIQYANTAIDSITTIVVGGTVLSTKTITPPGTTIVVPSTTIKTTTAPSQVVTAAANAKAPAAALMAGVFGAMALL